MCWAPGFEPEWVIDHIPPPCLESREAPLWITVHLSLTFTKNCYTLNGQAPKIQGTVSWDCVPSTFIEYDGTHMGRISTGGS